MKDLNIKLDRNQFLALLDACFQFLSHPKEVLQLALSGEEFRITTENKELKILVEEAGSVHPDDMEEDAIKLKELMHVLEQKYTDDEEQDEDAIVAVLNDDGSLSLKKQEEDNEYYN